MIWYTADHHFNHHNIIEYTGRPFKTVAEMDRVLIEAWNSCVRPGDFVFHLGDFCFHKRDDPAEYLNKLNGTVCLICGNHDRKRVWRRMPFSCERMEAYIGEFHCLLNHRPLYPRGSKDPFCDSQPGLDPANYDFVISGHIHQKRLWSGNSLNVGVDMHDFKPLSEVEVVALLTARAASGNVSQPVVEETLPRLPYHE